MHFLYGDVNNFHVKQSGQPHQKHQHFHVKYVVIGLRLAVWTLDVDGYAKLVLMNFKVQSDIYIYYIKKLSN